MPDLRYDIVKNIDIISEGTKGWKKEINIVSWNERAPKVDIRDWDQAHGKMGRGITLSRQELLKLKEILDGIDIDQLEIG